MFECLTQYTHIFLSLLSSGPEEEWERKRRCFGDTLHTSIACICLSYLISLYPFICVSPHASVLFLQSSVKAYLIMQNAVLHIIHLHSSFD